MDKVTHIFSYHIQEIDNGFLLLIERDGTEQRTYHKSWDAAWKRRNKQETDYYLMKAGLIEEKN